MLSTAKLAALPAVLLLSGCATTAFQSTWRDPSAQPANYAGQKVVAVVASPNESNRRAAETALAAELTKRGAIGVPSYTLIPDDSIKDKEKTKAVFEKEGAVGAVVMQVTGSDKEISSTPSTVYAGPMYGGFYGGWYGWGWGMPAYSGGTVRTDTIVKVETLVYSLRQDKLIWAGTSKTTNPDRADAFIKELVEEAAKEMKKAGLITAAAK